LSTLISEDEEKKKLDRKKKTPCPNAKQDSLPATNQKAKRSGEKKLGETRASSFKNRN